MNHRTPRRGFTLFEVILALAILGLATAVISQVVRTGLENARMTRELVQAELIAETVMAELLSGIRPLESVADSSFDEESGLEDPDQWTYSITVTPLETTDLHEIRVTVSAARENPGATTYSLVRWKYVPETKESS